MITEYEGGHTPPIKARRFKQRTVVMERSSNQYSDNHTYFVNRDEDNCIVDGHYLSREEYEGFGFPSKITVTVVAGDQLNRENGEHA